MNRRWIGFELSDYYADIALKEINNCKENEEINIFIGFPKYPDKNERKQFYIDNKNTLIL